jgi:hypothetical protein
MRTALKLIEDTKAYLEQLKDPIFASEEDCAYFRKLFKKPLPPPAPVIKPVFVPPPVLVKPPEPAPAPKPVIVEEPAAPIKPREFTSEWSHVLRKTAPELAQLKNVPSDAIAKKINTRWKTKNQTAPITVLYLQEIPEQKALLEEITKALDIYFGPAKLVYAESIEKEKQWEALLTMPDLRLIICCDFTLWQLSGLMKFYKEIPASNNRQLGDKPLFLLPDLSLYLKDPLLKRSLWKALCQIQK